MEKKLKNKNKVLYYIIQTSKFIKKCILFLMYQMIYKWKVVIAILSIIGIKILNNYKEIFSNALNYDLVKEITFYKFHNNIYLPLYIIELLLFSGLIYILCTKYKKRDIKHKKIEKVKGLRNGKNETPYVLNRNRLFENLKIEKWYFNANGVNIDRWKENDIIKDLETALNRCIVEIKQSKNTKNKIVVHTIHPKYRIPQAIYWENNYLSNKPFELILGENINGKIKINLDATPHILLGGATGCGKSTLAENLIYQAREKNAIVIVADMKGLDFSYVNDYENKNYKSFSDNLFDKQCRVVTDNESLINQLKNIEEEIIKRKINFSNNKYNNINKYNKENPSRQLSRIILFIDEVGTLLLDDNKELIKKLSYIAMQGRAFGVHLILSTQRPDCKLLDGQIKSNLDVRICGRTPDRSLSEVVLGKGNYNADTMIGKEERGVFITNNDEIFRGYMFKNDDINFKRDKKIDNDSQ